MNKDYIELDKYNGIVTDDNGKVDFVSVSNSSNIEDILIKENELEDLNNKLEKCSKDIGLLKISMIMRPFISGTLLVLFLFTLIISLTVLSVLPWYIKACFMAFMNVPGYLVTIKLFGTYRGNRKKKQLLNSNKENLERKIKIKTDSLQKTKNDSLYKRNNESIVINPSVSNNNTVSNNVEQKTIYKKKVLIKTTENSNNL